MALADTARLVASLELQDKFSGPARGIGRSLGGLERQTSSLGRIGSETSRGIGTLTGNLVRFGAVAGTAIVGGLTASVIAASNLNEEIDKSAVVFGNAADDVQAFSRNAASIGLSTAEALGAAGAFGNMFNTIGLAESESADMSVTMVQLAADMASFNNEDPAEMLLKLRSGLAGEAEPLRRFGVLLSEAAVREFAMRTGIVETGEALTEQQKVQARYGLILEQTAIQQGNFADTADSLANQTRTLKANFTNLGATIGTAMLPPLGKVLSAFNDLIINKQPQIAAFGERLGESLSRVLTDENITRGMDSIGDFIDRLSTGDVSGVFSGLGGAVEGIGALPWQAIGDAARLLGTGSKALLDAFVSLPPWVQTAVLSGWGLNKLTGGALTGIVGTVGEAFIKRIMGINAGVVNINAAVVNGGGGGLPAAGRGGGGLLGGLARGAATGVAAASPVLAGVAAVEVINFENMRTEQRAGLQGILDELPRSADTIDASIDRVNEQINLERPLLDGILFNTNVRPQLEEELAELVRQRGSLAKLDLSINSSIGAAARSDHADAASAAVKLAAINSSIGSASRADHADVLAQISKQEAIAGAVRGSNVSLAVIAAKKSSVNVTTHVTSNVSISDVQRRITSSNIAQSTAIGGGGFAV